MIDKTGLNPTEKALAQALERLSRDDLEAYAMGICVLLSHMCNSLGMSAIPIVGILPSPIIDKIHEVSRRIQDECTRADVEKN